MRWVLALVAVSLSAAEQPVSFSKDILPIFQASCWKCHGTSIQLSKLDLRTRESAIKGGEHGPAIVPGSAAQSRMFRLVSGLEKPSMPMDGKLTAEQIGTLKNWIDQGAPWETVAVTGTRPEEDMAIPPEARKYWAFQLPSHPAVPDNGARHPIDAFLLAAMAQKGLEPAPPADRRTLVRRAYLDLIGLPPTPAEVDEFLNDTSPDAWERLIDRLLASPHYGERWGRHWLDVARYADSNGFEHDFDRPNAWRYRDYVIRASIKDTPYDVFLQEQIAGDELDWVTHDSLIATGLSAQLRQGRFPREGQPAVPLRVPRRHDRHHRPRASSG